MADQKHKDTFRRVMERVRSMGDAELIERIKAHGRGELGEVFGAPNSATSFHFSFRAACKVPVSLLWSEQDFVVAESDDTAANDDSYAKAA